MENLELVSEQTHTHGRETFNGKVINYHFSYTTTEAPQSVSFNVEDEVDAGVQRITGNFFPNNSQIQVTNNGYQVGDGALVDHIYETCIDIVLTYSPTQNPE